MVEQRAVVRWYTVSQSVVRAWEREVGWRRGAGTREARGCRAKAQSPKPAQLNGGHKSCLVVSTSRSRPSIHREGKAELSPNDNITAAREQLAREPSPSAKRVVAIVVDL